MKNDSLPIKTFDPEEFADRSSKHIKGLIEQLLLEKNQISVALSGGNSPLPIYKRLSAFNLEWARINFFLVDERCVSSNHPDSNFGNIKRILFDNTASLNFPMVSEGLSYQESASAYEKLIWANNTVVNELPQIDLVLLGMGLDGHTASLFPNTMALNNTDDLVVLNQVPQLNSQRITMTFPLLLNAKKIVLIAPGKEKKKVLDNIFDNKYPISKIIPQIDTILN